MTHCCSVCGEVVLVERHTDYEYPPGSGSWERDTRGELSEGAGECESCGKYFCAWCNELANGVCPECREEEGDGYIPF